MGTRKTGKVGGGGVKQKKGCKKTAREGKKYRHECQKKTGKWVSEMQASSSKKTWRGYKLNRQEGVKSQAREKEKTGKKGVWNDRQRGG
jgi:hypothetical protein